MLRKLLPLIFLIVFVACNSPKEQVSSIVEVVDMDYRFSTHTLVDFCAENGINKNNIYQWQNHWIIFGQNDPTAISSKLSSKFHRLKINLYKTPFYNFNREAATGEKPAKQWTHVIMTANLVADTVKQKEYMEHHRTQSKLWPELSAGFARAGFQQVLVYRNGRQLMLVISIPKGKTLDELNPKTTENNPRVNDWNKMMAQYQEGIEDAPKGSTWVMFNSINR